MEQSEVKKLKGHGFLPQVQKERVSLRIRVDGGQIPCGQLKSIGEIAERYGTGYVHVTSRQGIEIPFIKLEDVEAVKKAMADAGLSPGACGTNVRAIVACQGSAVCSRGLIDTTELAQECAGLYYGRPLPHKFKMAITGCKNNCLKAEENDLGIKGGVNVRWNKELCNFCTLCEKVCPQNETIKVDQDAGELHFNEATCLHCGRCLKACPQKAWSGENGYLVYFGGLFGNRITTGQQFVPKLFSKQELHQIIEFTLSFMVKHGLPKERFATVLDRTGREIFIQELEEVLVGKRTF